MLAFMLATYKSMLKVRDPSLLPTMNVIFDASSSLPLLRTSDCILLGLQLGLHLSKPDLGEIDAVYVIPLIAAKECGSFKACRG